MKNFFKKKWFIFLIVIIPIVLIINQQIRKNSKKEEIIVLKKQNLKETLTLSGNVNAEDKVVLKFQTSGRLAWVGVKEGDYVKKYQVIASLDKRELKNRLDKYLNNYLIQRNSFEQTKDDYQETYEFSTGDIHEEAKRILENNQYNLNNTVLDVEYQNLLLEYADIFTPIEGIVTKVEVPKAGVNITPANATFEIVNPESLYFSATVEQADVVKIKEGIKGKLLLDSFPDFEDEVKISYISFAPKTDEVGTVYKVKTSLSQKTKKLPLRIGMTGDVEFLIKEKNNAIALPSRFIKNDKKGDYVFVKEKNQNIKRYVKTGEEIDGKIIIESGLKEGDKVVGDQN